MEEQHSQCRTATLCTHHIPNYSPDSFKLIQPIIFNSTIISYDLQHINPARVHQGAESAPCCKRTLYPSIVLLSNRPGASALVKSQQRQWLHFVDENLFQFWTSSLQTSVFVAVSITAFCLQYVKCYCKLNIKKTFNEEQNWERRTHKKVKTGRQVLLLLPSGSSTTINAQPAGTDWWYCFWNDQTARNLLLCSNLLAI